MFPMSRCENCPKTEKESMILRRVALVVASVGLTIGLAALTGEIVTRVWILKIPPPGFVIRSGERPFFQMADSVSYLPQSRFRMRRPAGPRGTRPRKVAFIGDSVTYGINLEINETIAEQVQKQASRWDTYNFGTPGFGIPEVQWAIEDLGRSHGVDSIIYVFNPNDLYDAMPVLLSLLRKPSERFASYESYASNWGIVKSLAKDYFKFPFAFYYYWTMRHVAGPFFQASQKLFTYEAAVVAPPAGAAAPAAAPMSRDERCVYSPMVPKQENDHYVRTYPVAGKMLNDSAFVKRLNAALARMSTTAHQRGMRFAVAAFYDKVYPDYHDAKLHDVLAAAVKPEEWIETYSTFAAHYDDCGFYISDTAHLAPKGTKLFAEAVTRYLDAMP